MDNSCIIKIKKIKIITGNTPEGNPHMKVWFIAVVRDGKIVSGSTIVDYDENINNISDKLARIFI